MRGRLLVPVRAAGAECDLNSEASRRGTAAAALLRRLTSWRRRWRGGAQQKHQTHAETCHARAVAARRVSLYIPQLPKKGWPGSSCCARCKCVCGSCLLFGCPGRAGRTSRQSQQHLRKGRVQNAGFARCIVVFGATARDHATVVVDSQACRLRLGCLPMQLQLATVPASRRTSRL